MAILNPERGPQARELRHQQVEAGGLFLEPLLLGFQHR